MITTETPGPPSRRRARARVDDLVDGSHSQIMDDDPTILMDTGIRSREILASDAFDSMSAPAVSDIACHPIANSIMRSRKPGWMCSPHRPPFHGRKRCRRARHVPRHPTPTRPPCRSPAPMTTPAAIIARTTEQITVHPTFAAKPPTQ